jgi:hypothetical protein
LEEILLSGIFIFGAVENVLGFIDQLAHIAELAVYGSETHISDGIDPAQILHDDFADDIAGNFPLIGAGNFFFDGVDDLGNVFRGDGTFVTRFLDAGENAVAIEGNAGAVFLDDLEAHGFFDAFVGGVAAFAVLAHPPATDGLSVFDGAGIDDAVFIINMAEGTTHEQSEQEKEAAEKPAI